MGAKVRKSKAVSQGFLSHFIEKLAKINQKWPKTIRFWAIFDQI